MVVSLGFYPFGEIVYECKHIDLLAEGHKKLPHNVYPPFHERPRGKDEGEWFWREVRYLYKALAVVAMFNINRRARVHSGPIIAYSECLVSKAVSPDMVATLTLMNFS